MEADKVRSFKPPPYLDADTAEERIFYFRQKDMAVNSNKKILVVEPHPDDGILSMGGYLYSRYLEGDKLISAVLFMEENEKGLRRQRESKYVWETVLEGECRFLNLPDRVYTLKDDQGLHINRSVKESICSICDYISNLILIYKPDHVFFPIGIGEHPHHTMTNLCFRLLQAEKASIQYWFYEDYPYSDYGRLTYSRPIYRMCSQFGLSKVYHSIQDTVQEKASLIMAYESQHDKQFDELLKTLKTYGEAVGYEGALEGYLTSGIGMYERIWKLL